MGEALLITPTSWSDGPTLTQGPSDFLTASTGPTPEEPASPSLTTGPPGSSPPARRPASPSSTTSTLTESSGTTWPATTRSPPCASRGHNDNLVATTSIFIHIYFYPLFFTRKAKLLKE